MPLVATRGAASAQGFGEFGAVTAVNYIESCFSTYLYTGTGATQTITNGIDLSGKGGLVWVKRRDSAVDHGLSDTAQGSSKTLSTNQASAASAFQFLNFLGSGFSVIDGYNFSNATGGTYASWTFRKQAKFFDVVTYTGDGSNRTISHNLGSVPGCIIVKRTDTAADWQVYHRSLANTEYMVLNSTAAKATGTTRWNSTTPTSTVFSLGTDTTVNASGGTYVAYLFAHDAGGFGLTGTDNVISCGSFTTDGSGNATVTLGYEAQWVLVKMSNTAGQNWYVFDSMRGMPVGNGGDKKALLANTTAAEADSFGVYPTATGFGVGNFLATNAPMIYIAIRRGPMKVPTSGTSVFTPVARSGNGSAGVVSLTSFPIDTIFTGNRNNGGGTPVGKFMVASRLTDSSALRTNDSSIEATTSFFTSPTFSSMNGVNFGTNGATNESASTYINYAYRRAPGFFDVVCYTGNDTNRTITHNLGVAPELMIVKGRTNTGSWTVYQSNVGATKYLLVNGIGASVTNSFMWNNTAPTSSVFTVGISAFVNASGVTYIAYLFASCPGVSKVGSYTGTGTTNQIDCGFTGGARYVLIKRTDSTGGWYVWDTARGIVAGNDPYLLLNSTDAEVTNTDYIDTYSAGFEISSTAPADINANGGTFIFLAIA